MQTIQNTQLLTREQAAVYLNVSGQTISRYVKAGILTPVRYGKSVRFKLEDLNNPTSKPQAVSPNQ